MRDDQDDDISAGGFADLIGRMEARRAPLRFAPGETLPPRDIALGPLARARVPPPDRDPLAAGPIRSPNDRKLRALRVELAGKSELAVLHGLLVAHLRKRAQPGHCAALFARLWRERPEVLLAELDPRWQVSAVTTFADHGLTAAQREVGAGLSALFGMMKLYETERRFSGRAPGRPFPLDGRSRAPLPLQMDAFALRDGGLDVNLLGRLWRRAEDDPTIRPLAHGLLERLAGDPGTVFARLARMRRRLERRDRRAPAPR